MYQGIGLFFYLNYILHIVEGINLDTFYPLIYQVENFERQDVGNYFGMSVAIRPKASEYNETWFIQIGAPRGDVKGQPNVHNPGAVYRCKLHGPCTLTYLDDKFGVFEGEGRHLHRGKEDDAWIGCSTDIKKMGNFERTVHFLYTSRMRFFRTIKLTAKLPSAEKIYTPKPYVVNLSTYFWGLGQAGTSVLMTEKPFNILIGAPGVTHWIGSVIRYHQDLSYTVGNFLRTETARKNRYTYLGYTIAAGRFYKDRKLWFAAGAPRSANYHGEDPTDYVEVQTVLKGATLGEYFGSALLAEDVNDDGYDDLIIGAPTYSRRQVDEGRIYVYLGSSKGNVLVQSQIINGQIIRGRFGSCIASAKDLDQNGYNDIIVGAPYENEQRGAIYIFRGFPLGLETIYSQRIVAESLDPQLRGFGISISTAVDVDGNKYNDVAVGAYLSGQVVLLRSRPIIFLHPQIKTEGHTLIDRKATFLNISLCSRYTGSNPPPNADIIWTVNTDPMYGRAELLNSVYRKTIHLRSNEISCEMYTLRLNNPKKNYSPLQIILKNELPNCWKDEGRRLLIGKHRTGEKDNFLKWCPIGSKSEISKEISFAGVCGSDAVCLSDMQLSCVVPEFLNGSYVVGSSQYFRLHVGLINSAEPAFNTKIKIWSNVRLHSKDGDYETAQKSAQRIFWKNINGVFSERLQTDFSFEVPLEEVSDLKSDSKPELIISAEVFTSNPDINLDNNKCTIPVKLISDADISLYSSSSPNKFFVSEKISDRQLNVTHYYEVEKNGVTPILEAELVVHIPSFGAVELVSSDVETSERAYFVPEYQTSDNVRLTKYSGPVDQLNENCSPDKAILLNCSSSENACVAHKIIFPLGIPNGPSSFARILMSINMTAFGDNAIICFATTAILRYRTFLDGPRKEVTSSALLILYSEGKGKAVEGYVIALSVLFGGFILFLLTSWLAKKNFFKRTKKQELKALKDAENCFVYFSTGSNPVGEASTETSQH
ncbi:hypothetical protein RUM43_006839 [Polyplax serrata]|uniref:Uncharacterized protein n=1 Tax=Polyplax serrata TaxID=468196 RepID=A0AAN8PW93_POLSC